MAKASAEKRRETTRAKETVRALLRLSPQSKGSLVVPETESFKQDWERWHRDQADLLRVLDDMVTDDDVVEYEDGHDPMGRPILMYRLANDE